MNNDGKEAMGINSQSKHSENKKGNISNTAVLLKVLAIIGGFFGAFYGINEDFSIIIILMSIISAIFIFAIGEGLYLLQEIANNTKK